MASLPFPCFEQQHPVDDDTDRASLVAVGRCRFNPSTCSNKAFRAICAKNKEQALVDTENPETKVENKKLKKKYMKQGVGMASTYLRETLKLDVSIVDVEIVVESKDILETDGCLAACILDAGCSSIVLDGTDLKALDVAKVPRERIVAHFKEDQPAPDAVASALAFAETISVDLATNSLDTVDNVLGLLPKEHDKASFQISTTGLSTEQIMDIVSKISKKCKDGKGRIGMVDPSARDLGLSYSACMRTDREDGLFTTVVCTRSGEALGLVYSSKVSFSFFLLELAWKRGSLCSNSACCYTTRNRLWRPFNAVVVYTIQDLGKVFGEKETHLDITRLFTG